MLRLVGRSRRPASWGGARPGAGRKRIVKDPVRMGVDFERADMDALRELAEQRQVSIVSLIRKAVSQYLRRQGRS